MARDCEIRFIVNVLIVRHFIIFALVYQKTKVDFAKSSDDPTCLRKFRFTLGLFCNAVVTRRNASPLILVVHEGSRPFLISLSFFPISRRSLPSPLSSLPFYGLLLRPLSSEPPSPLRMG